MLRRSIERTFALIGLGTVATVLYESFDNDGSRAVISNPYVYLAWLHIVIFIVVAPLVVMLAMHLLGLSEEIWGRVVSLVSSTGRHHYWMHSASTPDVAKRVVASFAVSVLYSLLFFWVLALTLTASTLDVLTSALPASVVWATLLKTTVALTLTYVLMSCLVIALVSAAHTLSMTCTLVAKLWLNGRL